MVPVRFWDRTSKRETGFFGRVTESLVWPRLEILCAACKEILNSYLFPVSEIQKLESDAGAECDRLSPLLILKSSSPESAY